MPQMDQRRKDVFSGVICWSVCVLALCSSACPGYGRLLPVSL